MSLEINTDLISNLLENRLTTSRDTKAVEVYKCNDVSITLRSWAEQYDGNVIECCVLELFKKDAMEATLAITLNPETIYANLITEDPKDADFIADVIYDISGLLEKNAMITQLGVPMYFIPKHRLRPFSRATIWKLSSKKVDKDW